MSDFWRYCVHVGLGANTTAWHCECATSNECTKHRRTPHHLLVHLSISVTMLKKFQVSYKLLFFYTAHVHHVNDMTYANKVPIWHRWLLGAKKQSLEQGA